MKPHRLIYDLPMAKYVADPCPEPSLSSGTIGRLIDKSPLHAWQRHPRLGGESSYSRSADLGSAAHALLLEGGEGVQVITEFDDYRKKDARALREEIYEAGKMPLFQREHDAAQEMAQKSRPFLLGRVGPGVAEVTAVWKEENGVWGRCRSDWLGQEAVVDYKTSTTAEPGAWISRVLFKSNYDISCPWYLRGLAKAGAPRKEYLWLVQETSPPFDCSWVALDKEAIDLASRKVEKAIRVWGKCLKARKWPGYRKDIHLAEVPAWRVSAFEEAEMAEAFGRPLTGKPIEGSLI